MTRNVSPATALGAQRGAVLQGHPDECPRCHRKIVPRLLATVACAPKPEDDIEEAMQCTSAACGGIFVAIYKFTSTQGPQPYYQFERSIPQVPVKPDVSDPLLTLSPNFLDTYTQALAAEALDLPQLTGIGLRKALEFLVKDFATNQTPAEKDKILRTPLGTCIDRHIADPAVQRVARRATWLGNDETHYVRKWEGKDIQDLKVLIRLTMNGVENVLLAQQYERDMPNPK